ncbi:hypothetical protein V1512DRAFT_264716 [Lipomyces arxii]|uniref:uncharacterized protein n=1 Tax=Lipomyces arxii TaxID=56418 RepID=UPI0034CDFC3F
MASYADVTAKNASQTPQEKAAKPVPTLETTSSFNSPIEPLEPTPAESTPGPKESLTPPDLASKTDFPEPEEVLLQSPEPTSSPGKKSPVGTWLSKASASLKGFIEFTKKSTSACASTATKEIKNPVVALNIGLWASIIAGGVYFTQSNVKLPAAFYGPNKRLFAASTCAALALATAGHVAITKKQYSKYSKK